MWLLLACTSTATLALDGDESDDPTAGGTQALPGGTDDGEDDDDDDTEPEPGSDEALWGCADLFEQDRVPEYHLTIEDGEWRALEREFRTLDGSKEYHPVEALTVDGESVGQVAIRLKGNEGYSWVGSKMQFVVSFVEYDEDQRFHGQRHAAFDATWYDHTLLNNRTASRFLRRLGHPAPCANNATLTINGDYYGVYAHMEEPDREFLERNFGDEFADGNLYKYGYELKNNPGADTSRIDRWWSSYALDDMVALGDPDQWVSEWAAEATMPDWDGYWISGHNYFLFDHPELGLQYVPWDLDATFAYYDAMSYDPFSIYWDYVPHERTVLGEPEFERRFIEYIAEYTALYDAELMEEELVAADAQIRDLLDADPNKSYTLEEHDAAVLRTRAGFYARRDFLEAWTEANLD